MIFFLLACAQEPREGIGVGNPGDKPVKPPSVAVGLASTQSARTAHTEIEAVTLLDCAGEPLAEVELGTVDLLNPVSVEITETAWCDLEVRFSAPVVVEGPDYTLSLAVTTTRLRGTDVEASHDGTMLIELGFPGWYDPTLGDVDSSDSEHARLVDEIVTGSAAYIDTNEDGVIDEDERVTVATGAAHPDDTTPPFWVAVGDGGLRRCSVDGGLNWTSPIVDDLTELDLNLYGAASGRGRAVAVGGWDSYGRALRTFDGQVWEEVILDRPVFDVVWLNDRFIGVGNGVQTWSWDGLTWEPAGTIAGYFKAVAQSDDGTMLAMGLDGVSIWSDDGLAWSPNPTLDGAPDIYDLAWGNGIFIAVGDNIALRSTDGLSWEAVTPPSAGMLRGLVYDGTNFTVADGDAIYRSVDGSSWTTTDAPVVWIERTDGEWVGTGEGDALFVSEDGESWTEKSADSGVGVLNALTHRR